MGLIAYDQPVKDLTAAMMSTGHWTHEKYRKKSVTLHHNAGINTHEQVVQGWRTREASTHFDIDAQGAVAQFGPVDEYAWAVGNTEGNEETISIEMCNETLAPQWKVADKTWRSAARLAGWLFAHEIGVRPSASNLFPHQHWYNTACPGPYMMSIWASVVEVAQESYDYFVGNKAPVQSPAKPADHTQAVPKPRPVGKLFQGAAIPSLIRAGSNQYLGSISGPPASHGGFNAAEKPIIKMLQQRLIVCGFVPGHTNPNDGWADGVFDTPQDAAGTGETSDAVTRFQRKYMPGTTYFGQVWFDDWAKLFNL